MRTYSTQGIVLKRINIAEADRIITLFSPKRGKIKILAKGIRKINSRRASHVEIFSQVKVLLYQGKHLPYLVEAQLIEGFKQIRNNFRKVAICYHLAEIVDKVVPENEINEKLYYSLQDTLLLINNQSSLVDIRKQVRIFVQQLLITLGYLDKKENLPYSQLLDKVESIIEKPLMSLRLLMKMAKENKA